ncbi:prepilin-type N-terminal cleavage/methylation domain-containing protein [Vreelandella titanicae]|uniref:PilW family protein n=1 Tax=Vreelandella titanicae TaxID=664683 RepID=UPI00241F6202|nr:prepilin-type N-terminal cleavage/methylation domain-containing protein [Halomonas titanicae]
MRQRQQGFTLVELMVALAIGTVIILGAGQLFLTTFQTFQNVDKVSRKQENLIFIAQRLTSEIRQSGPGRYTLRCERNQDACSCTVADQEENGQPMVSFLKDVPNHDSSSQCNEDEHVLGELVSGDAPLYRVVLPLENNGEAIVFHVMERQGIYASFFDTPTSQKGKGDAVIAGGAVSGAENILVSESTVNSNLDPSIIPSPQSSDSHDYYTGYINNIKNLDGVIATCTENEIMFSSGKVFYCDGNINKLNVTELSGKVVVVEQDISIQQNDNSSVTDVAIVAGGEINFNGNNTNALFRGIIWGAGSVNLSMSGVEFVGSVISNGSVVFNNVNSINADLSVWELLSVYGYEFSMRQALEGLSENIDFGDD